MTLQNFSFQNRSALWLLGLMGLCLILDIASKQWILAILKAGETHPILPFLNITLVWNYGISYGLFQQHAAWGQMLLAIFSLIVGVGATLWIFRKNQSCLLSGALALIAAGALGNGLDRILYGAVVDFIHFHVGSFSWYIFNLADIWIVLGAILWLWQSIKNSPKKA